MKIITPIILLTTIVFGLLFFLLDALIYVRLIKINDKLYNVLSVILICLFFASISLIMIE
jgi:preprotein translocase subunit SecE